MRDAGRHLTQRAQPLGLHELTLAALEVLGHLLGLPSPALGLAVELRLHDGDQITASLKAKGEAVVTARDIIAGPSLDVLTPEHYIATLGPSAGTGFRALLHGFDAAAYARHLKPLTRLT